MVRLNFLPLLASTLMTSIACAQGTSAAVTHGIAATSPFNVFGDSSVVSNPTSPTAAPWPVETSLKSTLRIWTHRQGWPAPQFLTETDWAVDVPGSIAGSIEDALKTLAAGFGKSPIRPRIEVSVNHVILVSEAGAE